MADKYSQFFSKLAPTRPFLKMQFFGFGGSGKTMTANLVAVGLHKFIKSKKPILLYYTERAGVNALYQFYKEQGVEAVIKESRTLADWKTSLGACEEGFSDVLVTDSITHVWYKYIDQYLETRKYDTMAMQDWMHVIPKWREDFNNYLIEAKCHIILTGRAGYEYEMIENDRGRKEIVKSGVKTKIEGEAEYEPDVVVYMEKEKLLEGERRLVRNAFVIKDRMNKIDGCMFRQPTFDSFLPAIRLYLDGKSSTEEIKETPDDFTSRETRKNEYITNRNVAIEKIKSSLTSVFPGRSKEEVRMKDDIIKAVFNTGSWTEVEKKLPLEKLTDGVELLLLWEKKARSYIDECTKSTVPVDPEEVINKLQFARDELNMPEKGGIEEAIQDEIPFGKEKKNG